MSAREADQQFAPLLLGVGDHDDPARGAHDSGLDGGLVGVGRAGTEACRDAVGAEERDIGAKSLDRAHGVGPDGGRGRRAHAAADDGERGIRRPGERVSERHRVRDDLGLAAGRGQAVRELSRDRLCGRAGVEVDGAAEPCRR